jgi:hypothetical protein
MFAKLSLLLVPALLVGCAADLEKAAEDPFDVRVGVDGKGDGLDGLLPPDDLDRLETAFDDVIESGQRTIDELESEIAALERDNAAKVAEIDSLVAQMEQRRRELEDQHDRNLLLCAFFPNPATCLLAVMIANDGRMQQLERDLSRAKTEQRQIREDLAHFESRRDSLRAELAPLSESRARLIALFREGVDGADAPDVLDPGSAEAAAYNRADVLGRIADATRAEIGVLVDIRNAAVELANSIDQTLATVRALSTSVDELVADARGQLMDMIEALVSGDPGAAARDWLDQALAERTRELLDALDWPVRELVDHLIATRAGGEVDADALARDLLDALLAGAPGRTALASSSVAVKIHDNTEATSTLAIADRFTANRAEITARIEHTFIGDLRVWIEHDGVEHVLHDRTGGADDDLFATFAVELPAGTRSDGRWTLHVSDHADHDTGRLIGWDLALVE